MLSRYVTDLLTLPAESLNYLLLCSQPLYPVEWPGTQLTERKLFSPLAATSAKNTSRWMPYMNIEGT